MKKYGLSMILVAVFAAMAFGIGYYVYLSGNYPGGTETMTHLYKGRILYQEILKGNWFPLYDENWYNGMQLMRYVEPVPVYVLVGCQALAFGDVFSGYLLFVEFLFFFGAISWLYIGYKLERVVFGAFMGCLWFFIPNNLFTLFKAGNLDISFSMVLLPLVVYLTHEYVMEDNWRALPKLSLIMALLALCNVEYAGMIAVSTLIVCLVFRISFQKKGKGLGIFTAYIITFFLVACWLYPSLMDALVYADSPKVMRQFYQRIWLSIDPVFRLKANGNAYYFGLSVFILLIFGIIGARKKQRTYFWAAGFLLMLTTTTMCDVLALLPMSKFLWQLMYLSIGICMVLFGFLLWKPLKKRFLLVLCVLLVVDAIPSVLLFAKNGKQTPQGRLVISAKEQLMLTAREITTQRLCFIDGKATGATGQYQATALDEREVKQTFGAGGYSATTADNLAVLVEAANSGYYMYLFDRAKEMGNDTVLIKLSELEYKEQDLSAVDEAARRSQYQRVDKNEGYVLYHFDCDGSFGVKTRYEGIGIGRSAGIMSASYPNLKETYSNNLSDYSFEELSKYKLVYLSGFLYDNKKEAEELVKRLADAGVKVVIAADGLPTDKHTGSKDFLGVICQEMEFQNGFPTLYVNGNRVDCYLFNHANADWKAAYLMGLKKETGYLYDNDNHLSFMGTAYNDNISFIGLNMPYHMYLTYDEEAKWIMDGLIGNRMERLPERRLVPLKIKSSGNRIEITSPESGVNTTLAYHDIFKSAQKIHEENAFLYVEKGKTIIEMEYPYKEISGALSGSGVIMLVLFYFYLRRRYGIKETVHEHR